MTLLATFKHISSKNADYGAAEAYLTFEHDEFTMKAILDENGRLIPREDYRFSSLNCEDEERLCFSEFSRLKREQGLPDDGFFHYDTPLTREHEIQTLRAGGFSRVELVRQWGNTVLLKAVR